MACLSQIRCGMLAVYSCPMPDKVADYVHVYGINLRRVIMRESPDFFFFVMACLCQIRSEMLPVSNIHVLLHAIRIGTLSIIYP